MERRVDPVSSSVKKTEKQDLNFCSDELILDYSVMNFPNDDISESQLMPILNYFW